MQSFGGVIVEIVEVYVVEGAGVIIRKHGSDFLSTMHPDLQRAVKHHSVPSLLLYMTDPRMM